MAIQRLPGAESAMRTYEKFARRSGWGIPIRVSAPATMDTAKLRWQFLAFGSLPRRREIVHDKRQPEVEEVQLPFPFSYNGIQQW